MFRTKTLAIAALCTLIAAPAFAEWNGYPCAFSPAQFNGAQERFKTKYGQLPGDFSGATGQWGSQVVNGNSNGRVDEHEKHQACDHLARSGLPMYSGSHAAR